jgi:hypothetical protein
MPQDKIIAHAAAVSAVMGKAKILNLDTQEYTPTDFKSAKNMNDIGERLLRSVSLSSPSPLDIVAAIEANDRFIAELEAIKARADSAIET